jgi:hypothetical protein
MNIIVANRSKEKNNHLETLDTMPHHLYQTIMLKKIVTHKSKGDEHHQNHKGGVLSIGRCLRSLEKTICN